MNRTFDKRHYVKLAEFWRGELQTANDTNNEAYVVSMYKSFVAFCQSDNPQFKESVFDKAAGYTD